MMGGAWSEVIFSKDATSPTCASTSATNFLDALPSLSQRASCARGAAATSAARSRVSSIRSSGLLVTRTEPRTAYTIIIGSLAGTGGILPHRLFLARANLLVRRAWIAGARAQFAAHHFAHHSFCRRRHRALSPTRQPRVAPLQNHAHGRAAERLRARRQQHRPPNKLGRQPALRKKKREIPEQKSPPGPTSDKLNAVPEDNRRV